MTAAPDLIQAVVGYRQWRVARDDQGRAELRSGGIGDTLWVPGVNHAECKLTELAGSGAYAPSLLTAQSAERPHQAPGHDCACGLYGMHELADPDDATIPTGAIAAWGRLEVHPEGFRAEFAKVIVLGLPKLPESAESLRAVKAAAERYGARLVPHEDVAEAAAELGRSVPEKLRPRYGDRAEHEPLPAVGGGPTAPTVRPLLRAGVPLGTTNRPPATTSLNHKWSDPSRPPGDPLPRRMETYEGGAIIAVSVIAGIFVLVLAITAIFG